MRARLAALFLLLLATLSAPARAADLEAARSAAEAGNAAYEQGDFRAAVEDYREAIELGLDHAVVHFNLGNALYKEGELGAAIASYSRAHRRAPRDTEIRTNLQRARAQIRDRELSSHSLPAVLRPASWFYRLFSLNEWARLLLLSAFLLAGVAILRQWGRMGGPLARRLVVGLGVAVLVTGLLTALHFRGEELASDAVVVVDEIEVRSGPGSDYNLAFRIHEGLQVQVAERRGEWLRIDLGGELVGWILARQVEML